MGQRANYIIVENGKLTIHYNHWRANTIASDLYFGEKSFLEFVNSCHVKEEIINEPWIEGCVIINRDRKELLFWSLEFCKDTSVIEFYLAQLSETWPGWTIRRLRNQMYDVEKILNIDYISNQKFYTFESVLEDDIIADKVEQAFSAVVVIKQGLSLFAIKMGNLDIECFISYGQGILSLIKNKQKYNLPKEGEDGTYQIVVVDEDSKIIFVNESILGLAEVCQGLWTDYKLILGDFGYIEMLRLIGVETSKLELSDNEVKNRFLEMVQSTDSVNPIEVAKKIKEDIGDVQFHANFFDNVQPRKPLRTDE